MKKQNKSLDKDHSRHSSSGTLGELAKTGVGLLKFGLDHADILAKIAKDTLTAHTEDSGHDAEAGPEEEFVEREEKEIVTEVVERKIVLSEGVLLAELQKLHPKDKWCIKGLSCQPDQMTVMVEGRWLGVEIEALIGLHIASLVANENEQTMALAVESLTKRT